MKYRRARRLARSVIVSRQFVCHIVVDVSMTVGSDKIIAAVSFFFVFFFSIGMTSVRNALRHRFPAADGSHRAEKVAAAIFPIITRIANFPRRCIDGAREIKPSPFICVAIRCNFHPFRATMPVFFVVQIWSAVLKRIC